jgi:hypothetical protein
MFVLGRARPETSTGTEAGAVHAGSQPTDRSSVTVTVTVAVDGGPVARLGRYRARDGSTGAPVGLDLDGPHAVLVVGKRGYGKSYTLGTLAESAAAATGVAPVLVDPMGALGGLADSPGDGATPAVDARVLTSPQVRADAIPPAAWPRLLGLDPAGPVGALVWTAASEAETLAGMRRWIAAGPRDDSSSDASTDVAHTRSSDQPRCERDTTVDGSGATTPATDGDATRGHRRAAANHLRLAADWDVFAPDGLTPTALVGDRATVLDCSGLADAPANALVRAVARGLYRARVTDRVSRLPWLFVDEAHVFFDGVAAPALETLLTRGRAPGTSLVAATQRPGALPAVAVSQSDLLLAHRLTAESDVDALTAATPTYLHGSLRERLPSNVGEALVVDDATESVHEIRVRARVTPHDGGSPTASDVDP